LILMLLVLACIMHSCKVQNFCAEAAPEKKNRKTMDVIRRESMLFLIDFLQR